MAPKHSLMSPPKSKKPSTMAEAISKSKKPSTVAPKSHQLPPVVEEHHKEMTDREENQLEEDSESESESASASSEEKTAEEEQEEKEEQDDEDKNSVKSDSDSKDSADKIALVSEKSPAPKASTPVVNHATSAKRSAESESLPNKSKRKKLTNNGESLSVPNKSQRKKLTDNRDEHDAKKGQGRLWTEQDELAIFNGLIEYQQMKQWLFTNADIGDFHQHIKKNLHLEADDGQLSSKITKMKSKYFRKGRDQAFTNPHDIKMFELSKKIWGLPDVIVADSAKHSNRKPKSMAVSEAAGKKPAVAEMEENVKFAGEDKTEPDDFWSMYPSLSLCLSSHSDLSSQVKQKKIRMLGGKNTKMLAELEEEWSGIHVAELELGYKKYDGGKKLTKFVLDLMDSGSKE